MPEVDSWGFGAEGCSHFSVPCVTIPTLRNFALVEFQNIRVTKQGSRRIAHKLPLLLNVGHSIHNRLFAICASIRWIDHEYAKQLRHPDITSDDPVRSISAAIEFVLLNMKELWDLIVPILDVHLASKPGQLPSKSPSFFKLRKDVSTGGRPTRILPAEVITAITAAEPVFLTLHKIRNGLVHFNGRILPFFRDGAVCFRAEQYDYKRGVINLHSGDVIEDISQFSLYNLANAVRTSLLAWLRFFDMLYPLSREIASPHLSVPMDEAPFGAASGHVPILLHLLGCPRDTAGYGFIWPCSPTCIGSVGGCKASPGVVPEPSTIPSAISLQAKWAQ